MSEKYTYDAFISYRHAPLDMFVAETLHKQLENFKIPKIADKETKELGKRGIKRIFRDRDELPLAGNLSDPITEALASSEYLIVICSPRILESIWCQREIETFIGMRGIENVFAVLIEGEPEDSFPKQLCSIKKEVVQEDGAVKTEEIPLEPLAADVRGKNKAEIKKKIKSELLRLVAPMIGCSYDDLKQRHKVQKMKKMLISAAVIGAACFLFGAFSLYQSMRIKAQSEEIKAQSEAIQAQSEEIQAQSEEIAAQAQDLLAWQSESLSQTALELYENGDRINALLVAMEGLPEDLNNPDRPIVSASEAALAEILQVYGNYTEIMPYYKLKHDTITCNMAMSPDGSRLVSIDNLDQLYSWDVTSGELLAKVKVEGAHYAKGLYFNAENQCILVGEEICCMNPDDLSAIYTIQDKFVVDVEMSKALDEFVVLTGDSMLEVYDALNGELISSYYNDETNSVFLAEIFLSEDASKVVFEKVQNEDGSRTIAVWDTMSGEIVQEYTISYTRLIDVLYTADNECYVMISNPYESISDISCSLRCYGADGSVRWEEYTRDGMYAPLCEFGEYIVYHKLDSLYILNKTDGQEVLGYDYGVDIITISTEPDDPMIEVMMNDGRLAYHFYQGGFDSISTYMNEATETIHDMVKVGMVVGRRSDYSDSIYLFRTAAGAQAVRQEEMYGFSKILELEDNWMLLYTNEGIAGYDPEAKEIVYEYDYPGYYASIYENNGNVVIITDTDIVLLDAHTGEVLKQLTPAYAYEWVYNGENIYICGMAKDICYVIAGSDLSTVATYENVYFDQVVVSEDGKHLIGTAIGEDNDFYLNLETGEISELEGLSNVLIKSPDDEHYLYADINSMKIVYATIYGQETVNEMDAQSDYIESMCFSPDGSKFYVYYTDERLEIYNTADFRLLKEFTEMKQVGAWEDVQADGMTILCSKTNYAATSYLLNEELEIVYRINGYMGSTSANQVYARGNGHVYCYPIYNMEMLVEEALAVLGDRELTPEERDKYNID